VPGASSYEAVCRATRCCPGTPLSSAKLTELRLAPALHAPGEQEVLLKMARHTGFMTMALAFCAIGACERNERERERVDISPARPAEQEPEARTVPEARKAPEGIAVTGMSNKAAIERMADARCARELRCENIGADKKFESVAACRSELMNKGDKNLDAEECPRGIDSKELEECMTEVKNESCGNPLDTLERLAACRPSDLCLSAP